MSNESANAAPVTKRSTAWVLTAFGLLALVLAGWRTIATPDIWTHIATGRDIYAHGIPHAATLTFALPANTPWVDATWLYDLSVAALWKFGGAKLVTLAHIGAVMLAFALLSLAAMRRGESEGWSVVLALAMTTWLLLPSFSPGPLLCALVFPAVFLAMLWRGSCWKCARFVLPAMQAAWTGIHPSFLLGPALAALFAADAWLEERRGSKPQIPAMSLGILAGVLLLLTLANPYGFGLHLWLAQLWLDPTRNISLDAASAFSSEFMPTALGFSFYVALAIIAVGLVAIRQRLSAGFAGAAVIGAFLLVRSGTLTPLSAVLIFPFIATSLTAASVYIELATRPGKIVAAVATALLLGIIVSGTHLRSFGLASRFGLGIQNDAVPADAAAVITRTGFPGRMLNLAADGGFLATRIRGREIFCDTRGSLYGGAFYDEFARALVGEPQAMSALENSYHADAILLDCAWPLSGNAAHALIAQGRWALAYFDGTSAIFLRNTIANLQFLRDRHLQQGGLARLEAARRELEEKGAKMAAGNSSRLIGAGHIFLGLGRFAEAETIYRLLTHYSPRMHGAWLGLGIAQEQLGQHTDAIATLQTAAKMRGKDPLPLLWLNSAFRAVGQTKEADDALVRAKEINPAMTEVFLKNPPAPAPRQK